jgi:hypothetical protein
MRLSADPHKLSKMAAPELQEAIAERRAAIRAHRDAKGDDRCWVDDHAVWSFVDAAPPDLTVPPSFDESMDRCRAFYHHRRADAPDAPLAGGPSQNPDGDIARMTHAELVKCLVALQTNIRNHANIKDRPRNIDDDRALYGALPDRVAADFRLPPEPDFLGDAKAPHAGCPSFWRSHGTCAGAKHDLHKWGPCKDDK